MRSSSKFFLAGRSIPAWVRGLMFVSATQGAQEWIRMAANGAALSGRRLDVNVNLRWCGVLIVFGGVMLFFGKKARA